jgi:hypothetical protein
MTGLLIVPIVALAALAARHHQTGSRATKAGFGFLRTVERVLGWHHATYAHQPGA